MATISYVVNAVDSASETFRRIGGSADDLLTKMDDLSHKSAMMTVGLKDGDKTKLAIDDISLKMAKLGEKVATPGVSDRQIAAARLSIDRLDLKLDALDKKRTTIHIAMDKAAGASFLQPSAIGALLALLPTVIPVAAAAAAGVAAITVSFGAAAIGAGAFGLLAKSALTQASTAAAAVEAAQTTYNAAIASGTKQSTAYAAEQRAISVAYAGMSRQQIALAQTVALLSQGWDSVKKSLAPVINGALVPWLLAVEQLTQFIAPLVTPVAAVFKAWGETLTRYFGNDAVVAHITSMATAFGQFSALQLTQIGIAVVAFGKGIFALGKDLGSAGNFYTFGTDLTRVALAFERWATSAKARADVVAFMKYLHDNGPLITSVVKDLAKYVPGIFAGASAAGQLELQALSAFLNTLAKMPPGWQKPVTELAGAMLLLSKTGVVSIGIKFAGTTGGGAALGGAAIAAGLILEIRKDLKTGITAIIPDIGTWFTGVGGILGLSAQGWASTIIAKFGAPIDKFAAPVRAKIMNWFKGANTWLVASGMATITGLWHGLLASWAVVQTWFAGLRGHTVAYFATALTWLVPGGKNVITGLWHGITAVWATVATWLAGSPRRFEGYFAAAVGWLVTGGRNIITGLWHGITAVWASVASWFAGLPGRVGGYGRGALSWLYTAGRNVIFGFYNGLLAIWHQVTSFISSIAGWIKAHKGPIALDSHLLYPAGRALMSGLHAGLLGGFGVIGRFIGGLGGTIGQMLAGGLGGLGGLIPPQTGALSGNAAVAQSFAASILPRGWSMIDLIDLWNQESGWNAYAVNPSSGAYGIPQSLGHGHPYNLGDYKAQIVWGLNYIAGRYGSSQAAWAHEQAFNWYGSGLTGGIFNRPTMIGVGERGPERVDITPAGASGGSRVEALLAEILAATRAAPARTAAGVTGGINGGARAAARSAYYSSRPR